MSEREAARPSPAPSPAPSSGPPPGPESLRELPPRASRLLQAACVLALVALGLMTWSLVDPRPAPVVIAMSVGQAFGTASLATFLLVVLADFRRLRRAARRGLQSTST